MSRGLYGGGSGLALGTGLYQNQNGLYSGASGLADGASDEPPGDPPAMEFNETTNSMYVPLLRNF